MDKRGGILIVSVTIFVLCFVGTASATTWSVDDNGGDADFTGIQDAINKATDGDTIIVHSGLYYENVVVDKSVTLKGIGHPVVDANSSGSAITLTEDMITLVGFTATNSGFSYAGIKVTSNNNTITGNTFVNDGIIVLDSYQNTVENNTVNGKPLVYLEDISDYKVEDAGQVILINCNNITVENLDLSNTSVGIELWATVNSKISNNNISNNWDGIILYKSCSNTITGNKVSNNSEGIRLQDSNNNSITGNNVNNNGGSIFLHDSNNNRISSNTVCNNVFSICLSYSSNNNIYLNNFINHSNNAYSEESTPIWNSPFEITYTYDGNVYTNYLGNYWDDYEGTDAEGDGIGNTHYSINTEKAESDNYPLMKPFENYNITTSAPA